MTEEQKAAAEAGKSTSSKTKEQKAANSDGDCNNGSSDFATMLNIDVTADFNAGQELVNRRIKAFGAGVQHRLNEVKEAMKGFTGGQFVMNEATYQRPVLAPSPEESQKSVLSLLFGSNLEVEENDQG